MRPTANFTLHAILAAALAALATTAAAAGDGATEHFFTITIQEGRVGATQPYAGRNDGRVQQIQVSSFEWSAAGVSKVDSFTVKQGVKEHAGLYGVSQLAERSYAGGGNTGAPPPSRGGVTVAAGDVDGDGRAAGKTPRSSRSTLAPGATKPGAEPAVGGNRSEIAIKDDSNPQATGENVQGAQDIIITGSRIPWPKSAPPPQGTLKMKLRFPWLACKEGKFYPKLIMGDPVKVYTLSDATVTGCSKDGATFGYSKVAFQPAKPH